MPKKQETVDFSNSLRLSSDNTLRANSSNAIMVSKEKFNRIMQLSEKYDLEQEVSRLNYEIERQKRGQQQLAAATWAQSQVQQQFAVPNSIPGFIDARGSAWGSAAHRAMGSAYLIAQQTRYMMSSVSGYNPSIIGQTAMRLFPY